ncbi:MAG: trimeric intracellular cation channel family protein [Alphaproteobacteria bacterium]|nr:trimeric intracellular cation channel family protein [Alphaproteobacteria bacterium]
MLSLMTLDYIGVAVFAVTGALAAARSRHDVVTFAAFAIMTGIGGGTLRDLLIGVPVFWVHGSGYLYLYVCLLAALAVWVVGERPWRTKALDWFDAVGLAAYAVLGAAKALEAGVAPPVAVVMGTLTATFGGIMRDTLAGQPSALLKREIYITAAVLAAIVYVAAVTFGLDARIAGAIAFLGGFAVRAGAIARGWTLPGFTKT